MPFDPSKPSESWELLDVHAHSKKDSWVRRADGECARGRFEAILFAAGTNKFSVKDGFTCVTQPRDVLLLCRNTLRTHEPFLIGVELRATGVTCPQWRVIDKDGNDIGFTRLRLRPKIGKSWLGYELFPIPLLVKASPTANGQIAPGVTTDIVTITATIVRDDPWKSSVLDSFERRRKLPKIRPEDSQAIATVTCELPL